MAMLGELQATGSSQEAPPRTPPSGGAAQERARGSGGEGHHADRPRPDIDQIIQRFLPLLGDIALAAHGDATARQFAEAALPDLEANGWRLSEAARRIWAGERDATALTAGLDEQDSALVRRALRLVADGPGMIFVARSLTLAQNRRNAERLAAQALAGATPEQRAELARQFEAAAAQFEEEALAPMQAFAARLRALAAQLQGAI